MSQLRGVQFKSYCPDTNVLTHAHARLIALPEPPKWSVKQTLNILVG